MAPERPPRPVPRAPLTDVVPKRTLVIIALVVVLAVLGTVLALTLGGGDDNGSKGGKSGDTKASASSGATAGSGGKDSSGSGGDHTDSGAKTGSTAGSGLEETANATSGASASASASSGTDSGGKESGSSGSTAVTTYKGGQGFSIGLPKGWKYESTGSAGARFTGPDGQKLLVGWTTTPKDDPVADWKNQERYMTRSQYKRVRIEKVEYRGWNTADWEFTYTESGTKYRSIDRGFVVNSHQGYALMYTAKAAKWDSELRKDTWKTFTTTFQPKS